MNKEIHQLRILVADVVAMNRELRARLDMHGIVSEEPGLKQDPRKPLLQ
jgi:hypothetical protein